MHARDRRHGYAGRGRTSRLRGTPVRTAWLRRLHRRALHAAVGAEDAAVSGFGSKQGVACGALMKVNACVHGHLMVARGAAARAGERAAQDGQDFGVHGDWRAARAPTAGCSPECGCCAGCCARAGRVKRTCCVPSSQRARALHASAHESGSNSKSVYWKRPSRSTLSPRRRVSGMRRPGPAWTRVWNSPFSPQGSTPAGRSSSRASS